MKTDLFTVTGMTCGGCVNSLTRALKAVNGVHEVQVTLASGETSIQYDEQVVSLEQIKAAILDAGYGTTAE